MSGKRRRHSDILVRRRRVRRWRVRWVPVSMRDVHRIGRRGRLRDVVHRRRPNADGHQPERGGAPAGRGVLPARAPGAHPEPDHVSAIRPYDERRLSIRFADGSEVVASRAGSQSLREMVRLSGDQLRVEALRLGCRQVFTMLRAQPGGSAAAPRRTPADDGMPRSTGASPVRLIKILTDLSLLR